MATTACKKKTTSQYFELIVVFIRKRRRTNDAENPKSEKGSNSCRNTLNFGGSAYVFLIGR